MKISKQTLLKLKKNRIKNYKKKRSHKIIRGTLIRPRLSVYRSNKHIYAQVIDDTNCNTLVACSTLERAIKLKSLANKNCNTSYLVGKKLGELSLQKKITQIVFDRGSYLYHGCIKALADGARAGGLSF